MHFQSPTLHMTTSKLRFPYFPSARRRSSAQESDSATAAAPSPSPTTTTDSMAANWHNRPSPLPASYSQDGPSSWPPRPSFDGSDAIHHLSPPPPPAFSEQERRHSSSGSAAADNDDLPMHVKDAIFMRQMRQAKPLSITPATFLAAGLCDRDKDAINVHYALVKAGILVNNHHDEKEKKEKKKDGSSVNHYKNWHSTPELLDVNTGRTVVAGEEEEEEDEDDDDDDDEFLPVTNKISSALAKQARVLSMAAVKELVKLLFYWEEEVRRWRAREMDEVALQRALDQYLSDRQALDNNSEGGDGMFSNSEEEKREERDRLDTMAGEVRIRIQAVRLRRRVPPSRRRDCVEDQLPRYTT
ncbi:hypothetical protein QBC46DRAFT_144430 [Diplogelasinospora grovesii]|uniref:Uncharacterized protein n=1 Tax=Diplogelasinospora grovesii TaxID=303347 RepID=A0AAN6N8B9_9PEZI|nr:hypothetical protein QBC46DRAFT_144430 [Diplogelasinospora grovesii]